MQGPRRLEGVVRGSLGDIERAADAACFVLAGAWVVLPPELDALRVFSRRSIGCRLGKRGVAEHQRQYGQQDDPE